MKETCKGALKFILVLLPIAAIAGLFVTQYELQTGVITKKMIGDMPETILYVSVMIQTVMYALICGFIGYILSEKIGLKRSFRWTWDGVKVGLIGGAICGIAFFALDYLLFANLLTPVADYYKAYPFSISFFVSEVVYGGVIEEIIMRWFLMSLLIFLLWKICARKKEAAQIPTWIFVVSNLIVAMAFAAGHLPATIGMFGGLSVLIVLRCFVLNGFFGIIFGVIYHKHGIQYAMIAHAVTHIVCDVLFYVVIQLL